MNYFRRRQNPDRSESESPDSAANTTAPTDRFDAYSLGARDAASSEGGTAEGDRSAFVDADDLPPVPPKADEDLRADAIPYERLGEHVSTVLSSAHEAADRLRASAAVEAEQIRAASEDYATKTRAAADAYAEERRENAETKATAITSDAEKRARALRDAAKRDADDIQRDALQRRQSLLEESERSEERLRNLLQLFRAMTERLESLVGEDSGLQRERPAAGGARRAEATKDDLEQALMYKSDGDDQQAAWTSSREDEPAVSRSKEGPSSGQS